MNYSYKTTDFDYSLPLDLIAQKPLPERATSRLLHLDLQHNSLHHRQFPEVLNFLKVGDLLVLNDTKVIPARLLGQKASGGKLECLVERILSKDRLLVQLKASKTPQIGSLLHFAEDFRARVLARDGEFFELQTESDEAVTTLLKKYGHIPLPPYIQRAPDAMDWQRYQTVYAQKEGAVAAPTAGLHFTEPLLEALKQKGVDIAFITLHVGAGTFQPIRVERLEEHRMHGEYVEVPSEACAAIMKCRQNGGHVVAVGTTVVRALETATQFFEAKPFFGETHLFIYPGYRFQCVDALLTNFHLPRSSLLMLVSALGGYDLVMRAYQEAIEQKYRFFSYGDAMLLSN